MDRFTVSARAWLHEHPEATRREKKSYIEGVVDALLNTARYSLAEDVRRMLRPMFFPDLLDKEE